MVSSAYLKMELNNDFKGSVKKVSPAFTYNICVLLL